MSSLKQMGVSWPFSSSFVWKEGALDGSWLQQGNFRWTSLLLRKGFWSILCSFEKS